MALTRRSSVKRRKAPTLSERRPRSLVVDGETLEVRVRESNKARTSRIVVGPGRPAELIVPRGVSDAEIDQLLDRRRDWILAKTRRAAEVASEAPRLELMRSGVVWLELEAIPVEIARSRSARTGPISARLDRGRLVVGPASSDTGHEALVGAIARWYRREARRLLTESVEREAARLGLDYGAVAIRDQRTRWGSCSRRGTLSLNWRLVIAPKKVSEYVVIHELCHLRELNHSSAFWRLLDESLPGWQEHRHWLREHGRELQAYEVGAWPDCGNAA